MKWLKIKEGQQENPEYVTNWGIWCFWVEKEDSFWKFSVCCWGITPFLESENKYPTAKAAKRAIKRLAEKHLTEERDSFLQKNLSYDNCPVS